MRTSCTLMAGILLVVGCGGDVPTRTQGPFPVAPSPSLTHRSGCVAPAFNVFAITENVPMTTGQVSGDLIGTVTLNFTGVAPLTGVTNQSVGVAEWNITDGVAGALIFRTRFRNRNHLIDNPASPADVVENRGIHRALDGVGKANFTYRGVFSFGTPSSIDHDYRGVLCP